MNMKISQVRGSNVWMGTEDVGIRINYEATGLRD